MNTDKNKVKDRSKSKSKPLKKKNITSLEQFSKLSEK